MAIDRTKADRMRPPVEVVQFEQTAKDVLWRLRACLGKLVHSAPTGVRRAVELQRALGIEWSVAWQVFKFVGVSDPFDGVPLIPGVGLMAKVFRAARERGFSAPAIDEADAAYTAFLALVTESAGDRNTFDAMIATLGGKTTAQIDMKLRRTAFRTNSQLWGLLAKVKYNCTIYRPHDERLTEDAASIRGFRGLCPLRQIPPIPFVKRTRLVRPGQDGTEWASAPEREWTPFTLLEDFCSSPIPQLESVRDEQTSQETLRLSGIGRAAQVDCFAFDILNDVPTRSPERSWRICVVGTMPCELQLMDVLVPRGLADPETLRTAAYGRIGDAQSPAVLLKTRQGFELPIREVPQYLGTHLDALYDRDIPRCADMVRQTLDRIGWGAIEFDIFRCRVQYPVLASVMDLWVDASAD